MHLEVLNDKGKQIFSQLKNFKDFYLAGGTALALQLGHRVSVDFDLFSEKEINRSLLAKVKKVFDRKEVFVSVNNSNELTIFVDGTKITFLQYPFSPIIDLLEYENINLLAAEEIALTKAYTVGRRGSLKDYIDIYFLLLEGITSLNRIIDLAEKKYGIDFNGRLFLEQLTYLGDLEDEKIIFLKKQVSKNELELFFKEKISEFKL